MEFSDVVKSRRSVRSYDSSREISDGQLERLFELVKFSPSSFNLQPWKFVVVRNPENRRRLCKCAKSQQHVEDASAVVIVLGSTNPLPQASAIADDRMKKGSMDSEKRKNFEASVKSIASDRKKAVVWSVKSASLAAMTLMLAAKDMGIDSCPMEGFDAACVKREFGIPDDCEVVMLVTLGYAKETSPPRPMRFGYKDVVMHEEFGK